MCWFLGGFTGGRMGYEFGRGRGQGGNVFRGGGPAFAEQFGGNGWVRGGRDGGGGVGVVVGVGGRAGSNGNRAVMGRFVGARWFHRRKKVGIVEG